jgi:hypothetical protein
MSAADEVVGQLDASREGLGELALRLGTTYSP